MNKTPEVNKKEKKAGSNEQKTGDFLKAPASHIQTQIGNNYYINNNFYGTSVLESNNTTKEKTESSNKPEKSNEACKNCEKIKKVIF